MPKLSKLYTRKEIDSIREELYRKYGNKCAICEKPGSAFNKRLSVDHNHVSNKIRGLLCYRCNKFILGRQTLQTVRKMLEYLLKYDSKE
jgi:Recombination endonuclease VII